MSIHWPVKVDDHEWYVGAIIGWNVGEVIVPLDEIDGMTDAEIGATVRSLAYEAESAVAIDVAYNWVTNGGVRLDDERFPQHHELLLRHAGEDERIDAALELCEQALELRKRREEKLAARKPKTRPGYIYVIRSGEYYKIGRSNNPVRRMSEFGIQMPHPVEVVFTVQVADMYATEHMLHQMYASKRLNGEWFDLSGEDLASIRSHLT